MASIPKSVTPPAAPSLPAAAHTPFPTSVCGPQLESAIAAVATRTQAPPELIAHHLLTLAATAAQRLVSVRLPTGPVQPAAAYFLTMAGSGEGRGAAEALCVGPVRAWQRRPGPLCPPRILLTPQRPGVKDRYESHARVARSSGLFAGAVTDLLAPVRARRTEAATLSALWDGAPAVTDFKGTVSSPALSAHLVVSTGEGLALLRAPEVADAGLLGRVLAVQPASRIGARVFSESDGAPPPALQALHAHLIKLYAADATAHARVLALDEQAKPQWFAFAREVEAAMVSDGAFAPIRPLASRLAEHALRLAAIVAFIEDAGLTHITPPMLARGIALGRFYAGEALRLSTLRGPVPRERDVLAALQAWLTRKYAGAEVTLRDIYCFGPPDLRSATVALRAMRQLELLRVAEPVQAGAKEKGGRWRIAAAGETGDPQLFAA